MVHCLRKQSKVNGSGHVVTFFKNKISLSLSLKTIVDEGEGLEAAFGKLFHGIIRALLNGNNAKTRAKARK